MGFKRILGLGGILLAGFFNSGCPIQEEKYDENYALEYLHYGEDLEAKLSSELSHNLDKEINYKIFEIPIEGDKIKTAFIYNENVEKSEAVIIVPGFSAGGCLYLDYAKNLAKDYCVFIPDFKKDYLHFLGMEPTKDPLVSLKLDSLVKNINSIVEEVKKIPGYENYGSFEDGMELFDKCMEGEIKDERVLEIVDDKLFSYREDGISSLMNYIYQVNETPGDFYHKVDFSKIGFEGHSLAGNEILKIVEERKYWWSDNVKAIISKGGTTNLQSLEKTNSISKDVGVFFVQGIFDDDKSINSPAFERYKMLKGPSGYLEIENAGHMFFIDFPIGYLCELLPFFGDASITPFDYFKNNEFNKEFSKTVYGAFLKNKKEDCNKLKSGDFEISGDYFVKNLN